MTVDVNGTTYTVDVPALDVGASATVTVTDNTNRSDGDNLPVVLTPIQQITYRNPMKPTSHDSHFHSLQQWLQG